MLVLTRKPDQGIVLDDDVEITVLSVDRRTGRVRIGINAPRNVRILRKEISREIHDDPSAACPATTASTVRNG